MQRNNKDPNTFEAFVSDSVGVTEQYPGTAGEKKGPSQEEIMKIVLERRVELAKEYVTPHNKKSRIVEDADVPRVIHDAKVMHEMCLVGRADYTTAYAIAHPQVNDEDPLRFYVTAEGHVVVNPVILHTTDMFMDQREGCMSFPEEPMKTVIRFHKIHLRYQSITYKEKDGVPMGEPTLSKPIVTQYKGKIAQIIQHECQHLNGVNIYDADASAADAIGYGREKSIDKKDNNPIK